MKVKTKLIASIMSICLVCAVFAIGVFALKTANLKIGGDVSFSATGVKATISGATLTGTTAPTGFETGGTIDTTMTQTQIDNQFTKWADIDFEFDENATDIVFSFNVKNDSNTTTEKNNYIELDYNYELSETDCNVDVYPLESNNYIVAPGETKAFGLSLKVLNKEMNVKDGTSLNLTISLKHVEPVFASGANGTWNYSAINESEVSMLSFSAPANWDNVLKIPAVITDGSNNYVVTEMSTDELAMGTIPTYAGGNITKLILPNSIKKIEGAVSASDSLKEIVFSKALKEIGKCAFYGCTGLTSMTIPNYVTTLGERCFEDCTNLRSVKIEAALTTLGQRCFEACTNLTSVILPKNLSKIAGGSFKGCSNLEYITIPENVTLLGEGCFEACTNLTSVILPKNLSKIDESSFMGCSNLEYITIPENVTLIGRAAFSDCEKLKLVKFESIDNWHYSTLEVNSPRPVDEEITKEASLSNATLLTQTYSNYYLRRVVD